MSSMIIGLFLLPVEASGKICLREPCPKLDTISFTDTFQHTCINRAKRGTEWCQFVRFTFMAIRSSS